MSGTLLKLFPTMLTKFYPRRWVKFS